MRNILRQLSKSDRFALLISVFLGLFYALLPYGVHFWKTGSPFWIADGDELLYLSVASKSYFGQIWRLSDPVFLNPKVTMYPLSLWLPAVALAKAFHLGPFGVSFFWRIWSGGSIGLLWYILVRQFERRPYAALAISAFLMSDTGLLYSQPLIHNLVHTWTILFNPSHLLLPGASLLTPQWRIITPGLNLGFLLFYLLAVKRAITRPKFAWIMAAISLGFLYFTYFYFWTAALLSLILCACVDQRNRKLFFKIATYGTLIGLPHLIYLAYLKLQIHPDAFPRVDLFMPIHRFSEFLIPKFSIGVTLLLLLLFFGRRWINSIMPRFMNSGLKVVTKAREWRDLEYLVLHATTGLLLMNHQIITGLQIQNFHWNYFRGPTLTLSVILVFRLALRLALRSSVFSQSWPQTWIRMIPVLLLVFNVVTCTFLRGMDSIASDESVRLTQDYNQYRSQHPEIFLKPGSTIAGDESFSRFSTIFAQQLPLLSYEVVISPSVSDAEWDARSALQGYLLGERSTSFLESQKFFLRRMGTGPWGRDQKFFDERISNRMREFVKAVENPEKAIEELKVHYIAYRHPSHLPEGIHASLIQDGPFWDLWELHPRK